jgi:hypothetical protein
VLSPSEISLLVVPAANDLQFEARFLEKRGIYADFGIIFFISAEDF